MHENPRCRKAHLSRIKEDAEGGCLCRGIQIGIREHQQRRFASKLQRHALQLATSDRGDLPPGGRRPGKGDLVDVWMGDQLHSDVTPTHDDVDGAIRETCFGDEGSKPERGQWRLGCRLEHHRATRAQCRSELGNRHDQWHIPWHDRCHDADRVKLAALQWRASRLAPRKSSERRVNELVGAGGGPVAVEARASTFDVTLLTPEERAVLKKGLLRITGQRPDGE